eukprot:233236-Chlamydomonas_euryale.AAC.1
MWRLGKVNGCACGALATSTAAPVAPWHRQRPRLWRLGIVNGRTCGALASSTAAPVAFPAVEGCCSRRLRLPSFRSIP